MSGSRDRLEARDASVAGVVRNVEAKDTLQLRGRFDAVCVGPVEERREEYVALRDELTMLEAASVPARWFSRGRRKNLRAMMAAIPTEEKWRDHIDNLVTTVGKNDLLDKYLKGSSYTQTIRMGLKGTGTALAADTQASHASWNEQGLANAPTYTGNRKDVTMNAASGGSSTSPVQAFAITSTGTVSGCFINNGGSATKDNTTGVLFSAGDFATGDRAVLNGDTLNVTYTLSV